MNSFKVRHLVIAATVILVPGQAMASVSDQRQDPERPVAESPAPEGPRLSIGQIVARVEAQGYRDIEEVEREGDGYEVCAKDAQGREVELEVDGATGRVEKVEVCED